MRLLNYYHSIRYLSLRQLFARLSMIGKRKLLHRLSAYTSRYSSELHLSENVTPLPFETRPRGCDTQLEMDQGVFTFLNRRVELGWPIDWLATGETQLWRYNLHYFDYVHELIAENRPDGYELFRNLVRQWATCCALGTPVVWDPYPISLRLRNWFEAYNAFAAPLAQDAAFARELRQSLYQHAHFLEDNVEHHLSGNHLIENGRALLYAGLFFDGGRADAWRRKGDAILWQELANQFTEDGGHYERSPMYHQAMLALYEEVVSVLTRLSVPVPDSAAEKIAGMRSWLNTVLHPDGDIPLLNDAAFGHATFPSKLGPPDDGLTALSSSGYYVFRHQKAGDYLIFDGGPLGPDHQPGHGHCDNLSYELSISGRRFVVDSGVGDYYGKLAWRSYFRSTRAHNTVVVDGQEQSEIWSRFRVARRAHPVDVRSRVRDDGLSYVMGTHTGYRRLRGHVLHRRWIAWVDRRYWVIADQLVGGGAHALTSFIHFHPELRVVSMPNPGVEAGIVALGDLHLSIASFGAQRIHQSFGADAPIQGWYAPEFGKLRKNYVIALSSEGELPLWSGYVLWPRREGDVRAALVSSGEDGSRVEIRAGERVDRLLFDADGVATD